MICCFCCRFNAVIRKMNRQSGVQISRLMQTALNRIGFKTCFFKNFFIRQESNCRSRIALSAGTGLFKRIHHFTALITLTVYAAVYVNFNLQPFWKCIDNRCTYTVKSTWNLISTVTELATRMQNRKDNLHCRDSCLRVNPNRNSSSIILNCCRAVLI